MPAPRRSHFGELHVGGWRVRVSPHAAIRWRERARPSLSVEQAARELRQIAQVCASQSVERPEWIQAGPEEVEESRRPVEFWIVLGDSYAMPVVDFGAVLVATTCIARGEIPASVRNARRAGRRKSANIRKGYRQQGASGDIQSMNRRGAGWRKNHRRDASGV